MIKKMMLLALSVGALVAFAAPTVAGAQLLTENGTALAVGAKITATSGDTKSTTAAGALECANVTIHGEVTANAVGGSEIQVAPGQVTTSVLCDLNQTAGGKSHLPITFTNPAVEKININPKEVGTTTGVTFIFDIYTSHTGESPILVCHFSGSPGITYVTNSDSIHLEGGLGSTSIGCPTTMLIEGDFTLETANGTAIVID